MEKMQNSSLVKEQYKDSKNLDIRISIHTKYSANKQGFSNWLFEQYDLKENMKILELGCGNGGMWVKNYEKLPEGTQMILSDTSEGMLDQAKKKIPEDAPINYQKIHIQDISYEDKSMDVVIANMMLYHVPDRGKALKEVRRVLKDNGIFYCATYGENGIMPYIEKVLSLDCIKQKMNKNFTLQNGEELLKKYFNKVEKKLYKDALEISETQDLIQYIKSLGNMFDSIKWSEDRMYELFEAEKINGKIHIPKEYGTFIAKKEA